MGAYYALDNTIVLGMSDSQSSGESRVTMTRLKVKQKKIYTKVVSTVTNTYRLNESGAQALAKTSTVEHKVKHKDGQTEAWQTRRKVSY